jgi:hypothetical protein
MLTLLAALLAAGAQGSTADIQSGNLPSVFEATCLDGTARLSAGTVTEIGFNRLPASLQERLGQPASGKVWQLNAAGHAYLYVLDYGNGPGISPKVCGIASDAMDFKAGADALEARVAGSVSRDRSRSAQWLNAKDGYIATATSAGPFNVLQISWLSDADRATAQAQIGQMPH